MVIVVVFLRVGVGAPARRFISFLGVWIGGVMCDARFVFWIVRRMGEIARTISEQDWASCRRVLYCIPYFVLVVD